MKYPEWIRTRSEKRMAEDFRLFLWYLWRELGLPEPTAIQYDIAYYLQHGPKRRIVQAFRGVGKSWITAAYVLWLLWREPNHKVLVVSASKDRADAFSIFVKQLIDTVDLLDPLRPRDGQRMSNIAFDVGPAAPDQAPSVRSVGITGQLTGGRADTIVADDVEVPKNSATETQREKLSELVKEFDAVLKPGGQVVYLGTPQVEQSLYLTLQERGYQCRIWPARYTRNFERYRGNLAPMLREAIEKDPKLEGLSTEPKRFSEIDLAEREASYGRSGFALQFMLDTTLSDAEKYPLKLRDLIVLDTHPEIAPVQLTWASSPELEITELPNVGLNGDRYYRPMYVSKDAYVPYDASVMFIDPSGRGSDETAYAVLKMLKGMLYVRRWGGLTGGYDESTLLALAHIAKEEKVNEIHIEANYGDGMFTALFEPILHSIYPCSVEEYKVTGQKELRIIESLEPVLNQHRLVMDRAVIEADTQPRAGVGEESGLKYSGCYQLTHITKDRGALRHDDRVDVLAAAVRYFVELISNDVRRAEQEHRERLHTQQLEEFMKACDRFVRPGRRNWTRGRPRGLRRSRAWN